MGNKSTREIREKIEQFNEDSEKKDIEWTIINQEQVYEQMTVLSRYFNLQKLQLTFTDPEIGDITPIKDAIQGGEIFEFLRISAPNTKIFDADILPSHIDTLVRFQLDLSNTQVSNLSQVFQVLNGNQRLEQIYLNFNGTKLESIKLLDVHLFKGLKSLTLFASDTQVEHIDQFCFHVAKLTKLEELHLDFSRTKVSDFASLESALSQMTGLLQLTIKLDSLQINNIFGIISGISHCSQLTQLTLSFNNTNINDVDQCGELLKQLQNLEYLNFQFNSTPVVSADNLLQKIGYLTALKSLSLNFRNTKINSAPLNRTLDALQKLQYLKITPNETFDETILEAILSQEQLRSLTLDLNNTNVKSVDKLMDNIGELKLMRHLQLLLSQTPIEKLNLSNLSQLKNLRTLQIDVSNTNVRELIGLEEEIGKIKFLNYFELDIRDTKLKVELTEKLKELQYLKDFNLLQY